MRIIAADIESASADDIHRYGPGFVRLVGWKTVGSSEAVNVSTDPDDLINAMLEADGVTMHNGIDFDVMALAAGDLDLYERLCARMFDTLLTERHLDPVPAKGAPRGYYALARCAERHEVSGKDTVDFQGKLEIVRRILGDKEADKKAKAREAARARALRLGAEYHPENEFVVLDVLKDIYDGYDKIPQDDPDYIRYLHKDVTAQEGLFLAQSRVLGSHTRESRVYLRREHRVQTATGMITIAGLRVDVPLTTARHQEGQARLADSTLMLARKYGMPTDGKKPHTSLKGKVAFREAILATGISSAWLDRNWPMDSKGFLLTGKDVLNEKITTFERFDSEGAAQAVQLCETIKAMNGERTVYGTVLSHAVGDRVHPKIVPDQASGRWGMKDPGLTVLGKNGGKARERAMILADEGDVLVAIDADQIDMRIVAALSGDKEYAKLFGPGVDAHSEIAWRVFQNPACREEMDRNNGRCDCEFRTRAKVCGHSANYGGGVSTLVRAGVQESVARQFLSGLRESFPDRARWIEEIRELAGAVPYGEDVPPGEETYRILHTWAGRPVRVERTRAYTQATALLGQGGTRDAMKEALLKLSPDLRRRVRAIVHDEFVFSIPTDGAAELAQEIADSMAFDLMGIRISFGVSRVGDCWASCYSDEYCPH